MIFPGDVDIIFAMKYTSKDISDVKKYAERLQTACDEMLGGKPKSRALEENGINRSGFYTILNGIHRKNASEEPDEDLSHPAWQDAFIYDISGDQNVYLPPDFEEELKAIEERFFNPDEIAIINAFYQEQKSIAEISETLGIAQSSVRTKKKRSLKKLASHKNELYHGKEFTVKLSSLKNAQSAHLQMLSWIQDALDWLEDCDDEMKESLDSLDISSEARQFYHDNGLVTLGDAIKYDLAELFELKNSHISVHTE